MRVKIHHFIFLFICALAFFISPKPVSADFTGYNWGYYHEDPAGNSTYYGSHVLQDSTGRLYHLGIIDDYGGALDYDPTAGVDTIPSKNKTTVYISRFNEDGTYIDSNVFDTAGSGLRLYGATLDSADNLIITGYTWGSTDFDLDAGTTSLGTGGKGELYLAKYNSSLELQWVFILSDTGGNDVIGYDITTDTNNDIILGGTYKGTVDFDPGAGTTQLVNNSANYTFLAKYTSAGNFSWVNDSTTVNGYGSLVTDSSNNIYKAEQISRTISKYDTSGSQLWSRTLPSGVTFTSVAKDSSSNVYIFGHFTGTNLDFDPGAGSSLLTSVASTDGFILKLDSDGLFQWVRQLGGAAKVTGTGDWSSNNIAVYGSNLFVFGGFGNFSASGDIDFDGTAGTDIFTSGNNTDRVFLTEYETDGDYVDTVILHMNFHNGNVADYIYANADNVFIAGNAYDSSLNLNPFDDDTQTSVQSGGYILASYSYGIPDNTAPTITSVSASPTSTGATVTWTTNEAASTQIEYGLTTSYGTTTTEADTSTRVTSHSQAITGLAACTTYHYRVKGSDVASNAATGSDGTFTTTGCTGSAGVQAQTLASSSTSTGTGGTVTHSESSVTKVLLTIPAAYSGSAATFQIHRLNTSSVVSTAPVRSYYSLVGTHIYELSALSGVGTKVTSFSSPISVTMYYSDAEVSTIKESSLTIHRWSGSEWQALSNCSNDAAANTVTCTTTNFSTFALFGKEIGGSSGSSTHTSSSGPDLKAGIGGTISRHEATTIIESGTTSFDLDFDVHVAAQSFIMLPAKYTRHSPVYSIQYIDHFNKAGIIPELQSKNSILALHYTKESLGYAGNALMLPKLSLAYSPDGVSWKILPTSVEDRANRTVAALTKPYGYYAIVSGGAYPTYITKTTLGVQTTKTEEPKEILPVQKKETAKEVPTVQVTQPKADPQPKQNLFQKAWSAITRMFK